MSQPLLKTVGLKKYFKTSRGWVHAVDNVNIEIMSGRTLGVVGESGCGKSTLGRVVLRLLDATEGDVFFEGQNINSYKRSSLLNFRKKMQIVFQDPYSSLDPRMNVRDIIAEPMTVVGLSKREIRERTQELMETVGLSERLGGAYPHQLDGGRRQRIGVARALALKPKFVVCDEPVSALDVSIQAQILNLLMDLQDSMDLTYMFITHDLSVVKHISNDIAVMYMGQCVEVGSTKNLFSNPSHPYTKALLSAILKPDLKNRGRVKNVIRGEVTNPINPAPGCRFAPRCPQATERCLHNNIPLRPIGEEHFVACTLFFESEQL